MYEQKNRDPYPSDLSDEEWEIIEPYISIPQTNRGRKRTHSYREIWEHMNAALRTELRVANGREPEPSAAILNSQSVKTTETPGVRGYDAAKKVKGRKRHILVDTTWLCYWLLFMN